MTFELRVTSVNIKIVPNRADVHAAMASKYLNIVQGNFGPNGQHRPTPWAPLSPRYVKRNKSLSKKSASVYVGSIATLYRSGRLFRSIQASATEARATIWTFNIYAAAQQFGRSEINLPPRPFFPFYRDGTPTQYAVDSVTLAAEREIQRQIARAS